MRAWTLKTPEIPLPKPLKPQRPTGVCMELPENSCKTWYAKKMWLAGRNRKQQVPKPSTKTHKCLRLIFGVIICPCCAVSESREPRLSSGSRGGISFVDFRDLATDLSVLLQGVRDYRG